MAFLESAAEKAFREAGPMFHLYTKPLETDVFYQDEQDRILVLNLLAIAVMRSGCALLAFKMMSNHFHLVLEGEYTKLLAFFEDFKHLLRAYYKSRGRGGWIDDWEAGTTPVCSLRQFRTAMAYVIRNEFVVNPNINLFADPWSSGFLYFNPFLKKEGVRADTLTVRQLKKFTGSRPQPGISPDIYVLDGMAQPWSFVDYERAMGFYDNARQFVYSLLKSVEAQTEIAISCGERPVFTDEDLIPVVYKFCREELKAEKPGLLDKVGKQQLAKFLKDRHYASNGQIARVGKMSLAEVNTLFPTVAKAQIR